MLLQFTKKGDRSERIVQDFVCQFCSTAPEMLQKVKIHLLLHLLSYLLPITTQKGTVYVLYMQDVLRLMHC